MISSIDLRSIRTSPRTLAIIGSMMVLGLLALSIVRGVALHQVDTLYDPHYRWRQTFVVALSRMRDNPPSGYLGFKSIERVFVRNGFGALPNEDFDINVVWARQKDGTFVDHVLAEALATPIDRSEKPILIRGNDLGWIDYVYFSFEIFGVHVSSLFYFYYLLLGLSAAIFLVAFWRSPICLYVLSMYLIGHYLLTGYVQDLGEHTLGSVTNSRFYSVAALLPGLHVLLVILRRAAATARQLCCVGLQVLLLVFYLFCRLEVAWIPLMLLAAGGLVLPYREVWRWLGSRFRGPPPRALQRGWAAAIVLVASVGLIGYMRYAPAKEYRDEVKTHVIWHSLYGQMLSGLAIVHPEIREQYLYGHPPLSDNMVYDAVLAELRARNDSSSPIAFKIDGIIAIDPMRDMGAYDKIVRTLYFRFIRKHPWLFLESFYDNIADEYATVVNTFRTSPGEFRHAIIALVLSSVSAIVFIGLLLPKIDPRAGALFTAGAAGLALAALVPVVTVSNPLLCGTILVYLMLPLTAVTALPVAAGRYVLGLTVAPAAGGSPLPPVRK